MVWLKIECIILIKNFYLNRARLRFPSFFSGEYKEKSTYIIKKQILYNKIYYKIIFVNIIICFFNDYYSKLFCCKLLRILCFFYYFFLLVFQILHDRYFLFYLIFWFFYLIFTPMIFFQSYNLWVSVCFFMKFNNQNLLELHQIVLTYLESTWDINN